MIRTEESTFSVGGADPVTGLLMTPPEPHCLYVFAHGAGAGMKHSFMEQLSRELADRGVATFRYNFPYKEHGRNRPDFKPILHSTVRSAKKAAGAALPGLPIFAGGKSMGGRMTSEVQAKEPLPGVRGLIFVGFPLHPARKPATDRADHLGQVDIPMLFLQGTRDALAHHELMQGVASDLSEKADLRNVEGADHGFHVLKRSGRTDEEVIAELAAAIQEWTLPISQTMP